MGYVKAMSVRSERAVPSSPALLPRPGEGGARGGFTPSIPLQSPPHETVLDSTSSPLDERLVRNGWIKGGSGGRVAWLGELYPLHGNAPGFEAGRASDHLIQWIK